MMQGTELVFWKWPGQPKPDGEPEIQVPFMAKTIWAKPHHEYQDTLMFSTDPSVWSLKSVLEKMAIHISYAESLITKNRNVLTEKSPTPDD